MLFEVAAQSGALSREAPGTSLVEDRDLAAPDVILATLMGQCPEASLEIFLSAALISNAGRIVRGGPPLEPGPGLRRRFAAHSLFTRKSNDALTCALSELQLLAGRTWRVLWLAPPSPGILRGLAPLVRGGSLEVTVASTSKRDLDDARQQSGGLVNVAYLHLGQGPGRAGLFDAIVGEAPPSLPQAWLDTLSAAVAAAPDASVLLQCPRPGADERMLFGVWAGPRHEPAVADGALVGALTAAQQLFATVD
jgi:hypothetical protein